MCKSSTHKEESMKAQRRDALAIFVRNLKTFKQRTLKFGHLDLKDHHTLQNYSGNQLKNATGVE